MNINYLTMQKIGFILPKVIIQKINIKTIKQCIMENWVNIIPNNIASFIKFNKISMQKDFTLKLFVQILGCSIIIVKIYEKEIINNVKKITKIGNVSIIYQQVLSISNNNDR